MAIIGDWTSAIVDGTTVDNQAFQEASPRDSITGWVFGEDHHANASGTKVTSGGLDTDAVVSGKVKEADFFVRGNITLPLSESGGGALTTGANKSINFHLQNTMPSGKVVVDKVDAYAATAPGSGKTLTFDVNKNGTTIFTTSGNRPSITGATQEDNDNVPDVTTLAAGDELTVDIDTATSAHVTSAATITVGIKQYLQTA